MENKKNLSDREWEELASYLSGETEGKNGYDASLKDAGLTDAGQVWNKLGSLEKGSPIDVDRAWNKVDSRISNPDVKRFSIFSSPLMKIAAAALLILVIGSLAILFNDRGSEMIIVTAGAEDRNVAVDLPDGSKVFLNRNSELQYNADLGSESRNVMLRGEAFFDVAADNLRPFIIDAGNAAVRVVGTSFSVLSGNSVGQVEVFVKTGVVKLTAKTGTTELVLEPGYIGKMNESSSEKIINNDPNYLAWNTGKLIYKGEKLSVVFHDLEKVYGMKITADDPSIYEFPWHAPIDNQPRENIIRLICLSFNLSYEADGNNYRLSKK